MLDMGIFVKDRLGKKLKIALGLDVEDLKYKLLCTGILWDISCSIRKVGRYVKRLWRWAPFLWKIEDWDFTYLIYIMIFHLKDMKKAQQEDDMHLNSDRRAKQIARVISHLEHYLDIDKYAESGDVKMEFKESKEPGGYTELVFNTTVRDRQLIERNDKLERKHWDEAWWLISRNGQSWWT